MRSFLSISVFIIIIGSGLSVLAEIPQINVIYPKECSMIGTVDSTFIFGSVQNGDQLIINGHDISIHEAGGFLAFLPISPGHFSFELIAINETDTAIYYRNVCVPIPKQSFDFSALKIEDWKDISNNMVLAEGDNLVVEFQATPYCQAWFSIPGYADSVPMVEMPPRTQPYWGESVFGPGAIPDSIKIKGYYSGYMKINKESLPDSSRIYYHITSPDLNSIYGQMLNRPVNKFNFSLMALLKYFGTVHTDSSAYFIKINPTDYPFLVEFTDSVQTMRVGPLKGYLSIFQPRGIRALVVGREGDWLKLRLTPTQTGWVHKESVTYLDKSRPPIISYLKSIRTFSFENRLEINLPLSERHPFRVEEEDDKTLRLYMYGVNSDTDWIRYDFKDKNLKMAIWSQPEPELYCLKLIFNNPIWGYDTYYESNTLKLQINYPPQDIANLKNKIIVVDPGHSPDAGAIGPTGLKESEANLSIALALKKELEKKGATVVMTRDDMSDLPLYDRPQIAVAAQADLFISIHNNALPDGVNPFVNNGISTYYYHPHSIQLARAIQTEMLKKLKLPDYGLYHGNLAVNRPTQYPAVLVECAFMMIPEQEAMLKEKKFHKKTAQAIRKGIERFLKEYGRQISDR